MSERDQPHFQLGRRAVALGIGGLAFAGRLSAAEPPHDVTYLQDFDELWRTLAENYCYFGEKATDWNGVRRRYRRRAALAGSSEDLARVFAPMLAELYNAHTHLSDPPLRTPRFPPFDLIVEAAGPGARIVSVAERSAAALAGLHVGDTITHGEGISVAAVAADLRPACLTRSDRIADAYALNAAVAGRRGQPRRLRVAGRGDVELPLAKTADEPSLAARRLGGELGYIRIASFGDAATVDAFDAALADLATTRGLLIDVRANGGGDTAVARPIMGRFIASTRPYARMRRRAGAGLGPFWTETVAPRGPFTYARPVVVLCDYWSASMAEGFPMGMRAICGARIAGTAMMGLGAAVFRVRLDRTGIEAQYSAEPVYDVTGQARSLLRPDVEAAPGEDMLALARRELTRLVA